MKTYIALKKLHKGKPIKIGGEVELSDEDAATLLKSKAVKLKGNK